MLVMLFFYFSYTLSTYDLVDTCSLPGQLILQLTIHSQIGYGVEVEKKSKDYYCSAWSGLSPS